MLGFAVGVGEAFGSGVLVMVGVGICVGVWVEVAVGFGVGGVVLGSKTVTLYSKVRAVLLIMTFEICTV